MKKFHVLSLTPMVLIGALLPNIALSQALAPPPRNLEVNSHELIAAWQKPQAVLLNQNFEGTEFPPPGWQATTSGMGWFRSQNGSQFFVVPQHSWYAIADDDLAGTSNNGCCDFLISPVLNLTRIEDGRLKFDSYYNGDYAQSAEVEMSIDGGISWNTILTLTPSASWKQIELDLTSYCGQNGFPSVQFSFHADDNGGWASGWAIDNVMVYSDSIYVTGYNFYCNNSFIGQTDSLTIQIPVDLVQFGDTVATKVNAVYDQGVSDFCYHTFVSNYLPPPQNFTATSTNDTIIWTWDAPEDTASLLSYIVYLNQVPFTEIEKNTRTFMMGELFPGEYCLELSAKYELSAYGFPGCFAESLLVTACDSITTETFLPFVENWDSASFMPGGWIPGSNWGITIMNKNIGNNYAARFSGVPQISYYSSSLESQPFSDIYPITETPYKIILEFDLACSSTLNNGTENFFFELFYNGQWQLLAGFRNDSSFAWNHQHFDITNLVKGQFFKFRFSASGDNSAAIQGWFIDNISLQRQYSLSPPRNFSAQRKWTFPFGSELNWSPPLNIGGEIQYILDDNSFENTVCYGDTGDCWIGNIFSTEVPAKLNSASVSIEPSVNNIGTTYSIDVFNANRQLIGSSDSFIPEAGLWTDVALPDIQINGSFYLMLHITTDLESDYLLLDQNGPQTSGNKTWVAFDGIWSELTDYGFDPSVAAIRVKGIIGMSDGFCANSNMTVGNYSAGDEENPESNFLTPLYYKVYRTVWSPFPPYDTLVTWEFFDTTSVCHYIDNSYWHCGKFYRATAVYAEGESAPSNYGYIPTYTEIREAPPDYFSIFPNPAGNVIHVKLNNLYNEVELININGISELKVSGISQLEFTIDTSHVPPGNYLLIFRNHNAEQVFKKVVISK